MGIVDQQRAKVEAEIKKLEELTNSASTKWSSLRDSAFQRFPILLVLLSSFGLVSTFYGFEKVIDEIPFFVENPHMILLTGVAVLVLTGALYKKLS